jgi:hypothetical protein
MYHDPSHIWLLSAAPDAPCISSTNGDREIDSDQHTPLDRASRAVGARHATRVSLKIWLIRAP